MSKTTRKWLLIALVVLLATGITAVCLVWNGAIILNGPSAARYPVKGVDVSSYQGEIHWDTLAAQGISFAFIKATEGSSFVDPYFSHNFSQAQDTPLAVGAYHFFSYDSEGRTQAENFIRTVPPFAGMLPPVIDLEFYGDKERNPPERTAVEKELTAMLTRLEEHYGQKPIIYATEKSYRLYLAGEYADYPIWIRNVITRPTLSDGRDWAFWQYTNRERLEGYKGKETYIDMNVFAGSPEEFAEYLAENGYKTPV